MKEIKGFTVEKSYRFQLSNHTSEFVPTTRQNVKGTVSDSSCASSLYNQRKKSTDPIINQLIAGS